MKRLLVLLLASAVALRADGPAPDAAPAAAPTPSTNAPPATPAPLDDAAVAHQGYPATRYESLWTKSPFAVETPDEAVQESIDYTLVGVMQLEGVTYASLIATRDQSRKLIRSDKVTDGLIVKGVTRKENGDTFATVNRDGQPLELKLQTSESGPVGGNVVINGPAVNVPMPGSFTPNIPMPGAGNAGGAGPSVRPLIRIHRPIIHVPQRQADAPSAPPVGQPPPPPPPQ
jgi:hypothetical protein